jgi:anti-sigma factor RsiW
MTCSYHPLLSSYLDRALGAAEHEGIRRHLETCPHCQTEVRSLLQVKEALRRQTMPEIPADLIAAIESKTIDRSPWWNTDAFRLRWAPTMVGAAAALGAWLLFRSMDTPKPTLERPLPVVQVPVDPAPYQRPPTDRVVRHDAETPTQDVP